MNVNGADDNLGTTMGSIRTRLINRTSGAGVNAESGAFFSSDRDRLSELVWSPHKGVSLKCTQSGKVDNRPFLMWNVGPNNLGGDDVFVDRDVLLEPLGNRTEFDLSDESGKMDEVRRVKDDNQDDVYSLHNLQIGENTENTAADDKTTSENNNEASLPMTIAAPMLNSSPHVESSETNSRILLYKEKGKGIVLSDDESIKSCDSTRGIKRLEYVDDVVYASKRIKNETPLCCGSTTISKTNDSFMRWISNMVRGFRDSNSQDSSYFPLMQACSVDEHDSARLNKGFQAIFKSLHCKEMSVVDTKEEKENKSLQEYRQIVECDEEVNPCINLGENRASEILPAESCGERTNNAAEGTSLAIPAKKNICSSLWITRFCTKSPNLEKRREIIQECSTSSRKLNLDSGTNAASPVHQKSWESEDDSQVNQKCSANTEVSVDCNKSNCEVTPCQQFGSSEAMAYVFAKRLDALRHIMPSKNNVIKDHQYTVEIFHAIRNLRLSRADILRWMDSGVSLSHLNGYFLRLRLKKKLHHGLGCDTYIVACIVAGDAREFAYCSSKKCFLVDVGKIRTCITGQYVSNHDFLEDEIKAWWSRVVDGGCTIPSIDDLNSKFNVRRSLGF